MFTPRLIRDKMPQLAHWPLKTLNITYLFGLVTEPASFIRPSRVSDTHNGRKLAIFPTPHPLQKPHDI